MTSQQRVADQWGARAPRALRRLVPAAARGAVVGYTGRVRRGGRLAGRAARAMVTPQLYPRAVLVPSFWWEEKKNFGDLLTPLLLPRLGIVPRLVPAAESRLVGVGSLVQHLSADYDGVLWGTGLIHDVPTDLSGATCLALRGELTRDRLGNPSVQALGDPGLLLRNYVRRRSPRVDVGLVPHYRHRDDATLRRWVQEYASVCRVIDVRRGPVAVARQIAECATIVTTSLHGLIVADAFGIPGVWIRMPVELFGGDFKFADHETVARPCRRRGYRLEELESLAEARARAVPADQERIDESIAALVRSAGRLHELLGACTVPAPMVPARLLGSALRR